MTSYVGLDISLTATGLVVLDGSLRLVHTQLIKTKPKDFTSQEARYWHIAREIMLALRPHRPLEVDIEGPAFSMKEKRIYECAAVVRHELWKRKVEFNILAPSSLKKFGTGNGRASKDEMVAAAQLAHPEIKDDNIADAYHLAVHCHRRVSSFPDSLE